MKILKKHVSARDLWVKSDERLSNFYASSWQRGESPLPLLVIRGFLLGAVIGVLIWSLILNHNGPTPYWLIYLTNWGLTLNSFLMLSSFIVSCMATFTTLPEFELTPWYISMYWLFRNIAVTVAFLITILYWTLLYNPATGLAANIGVFWLDVTTHGFNSLLCMIELISSRTPVRCLHFYHPLAVGLWYAAFSGIYYAAGGVDSNGNSYIYAVLDWENAGQVVIILISSVAGILLLWAFILLIAFVRDKISKKYIRHIGHDLPT